MYLFLYSVVNFIASLFQSIFGFGNALIATPLLLIFLDKGTVVTANAVTGILLNIAIIKQIKAPLNKRIFIPLVIGSLLGMPLGIFVLKVISIEILKITVGGLSIFFAILILFLKVKLPKSNYVILITGFLSGFLQTSTTMPGPPLILLLSVFSLEKDTMRKLLISFFLFVSSITLILSLTSQIMTEQGLIYGVLGIPFSIIASILGNKLIKKIPQKKYQLIALGIICLTGISAIFSSIKG